MAMNMINSLSRLDLPGILVSVLVLTISLSFHEMCHAWEAYRLGDDTAALQGRLTMNPLAHLDPIGTLMFIFAGIGWAKPVVFNPARFKPGVSIQRGTMLVSLAGPCGNLILALAASILHAVTVLLAVALGESALSTLFENLFLYLYMANTALAVFNLLPFPPLDGSKIFSGLMPLNLYYRFLNRERTISLIFLLIVIFAGNAVVKVLQVVRIPFDLVIWTPIHLLAQWLLRLIS
jgi:Zn-dependent protease